MITHSVLVFQVPQVVGSQQLMHVIGGGNSENSGNKGSAENAANNGQVVVASNGGNVVHGNNINNVAQNGNNGSQQQYQHRPPRNNRGGGRGGYRRNQNQDGYVPRYNNNGGRGGNRPNNRQFNVRGRDYHGPPRDNNNHHIVQGGQEMMNGHVDQSGLVPMNAEAAVMMGQPIPQMMPVGQISLLGEPTGPPIATQPMMQAPPQQYQQQIMVLPQQEIPMQDISMAVVPQLMSGAPMQNGLLQDPMMAGPSMSVPPPLYAMPPPNGMVLVPADGASYNNNKWISYQSMEVINLQNPDRSIVFLRRTAAFMKFFPRHCALRQLLMCFRLKWSSFGCPWNLEMWVASDEIGVFHRILFSGRLWWAAWWSKRKTWRFPTKPQFLTSRERLWWCTTWKWTNSEMESLVTCSVLTRSILTTATTS